MVVPAGWKEVRLGDLGSTFGGLTGKSSRDFGEGNSRFVTFMNVMSNVVLNTQGTEKVRIGNGERQSQVLEGDVIFNGSSETPEEVGFGSAVPIEISGLYLNSFCFGFRRKDTKSLDPRFFAYLTRSPLGRDIIRPMAQGSTRYNIAKTNLLNGRFPLPPLKEQEAISEALSDTDTAIESLDALIAKKRDVKQATMQQLLTGRTRLPGFTADWNKTELRSVLKFQVGFPFSSQSFASNGIGIRLIRNADLKSASSAVSIVGAYPEEFVVQSGDLLIGMDGDFAPIIWKGGFALLNQRVGRVICGPEMNKGYARYELVSHLKEIEIRTGATTVKHLSHDDVASIVLTLPPLKEQEAIAETLSAMDDELEALTEQVSKLRMVKEGMMQDLLTGKVRLV